MISLAAGNAICIVIEWEDGKVGKMVFHVSGFATMRDRRSLISIKRHATRERAKRQALSSFFWSSRLLYGSLFGKERRTEPVILIRETRRQSQKNKDYFSVNAARRGVESTWKIAEEKEREKKSFHTCPRTFHFSR